MALSACDLIVRFTLSALKLLSPDTSQNWYAQSGCVIGRRPQIPQSALQLFAEMAELTGLSIADASQHLQHLKRAGFVFGRREGKHVLYRLGNGPIVPLLSVLQDYAVHNHSEIRELVLMFSVVVNN
ncbi:ArsR/SmtB family transcription factor [Yersinia aldovae]|uniref:ArsR/SmtB family transcription factor n=1 Tax=Yersinia aldovae TaxID=29483 RepID=UPI0005AD58D2|nr:helix-turn-helix domain-containing protein [Yersinia aldovae]AJJ63716.1 transcriptional regulator, ArsR family [Yersinia aldovae 670-83]